MVQADYAPGLHFKIPFVQNVRTFDARIQTTDADPERYLTGEKKNVLVDSFVKWRIGDVERFYTSTGGDVNLASSRLSQFVKKGLKDEFGKRTIQQVVSGERGQIMERLAGKQSETGEVTGGTLRQEAAGLGIQIVDVRIKRIDLPEDVSVSVYRRMQAERQRVAREFRSRGHEVAKRIRAEAERERTVILAEAERDSQTARGEGDAIAAETYAKAYDQDPDFYAFYRSLDAYRSSFRDRSDILLLDTESDFFRFFRDPAGG